MLRLFRSYSSYDSLRSDGPAAAMAMSHELKWAHAYFQSPSRCAGSSLARCIWTRGADISWELNMLSWKHHGLLGQRRPTCTP